MANYDYNIDELFGESARQYTSKAPEGMWDALDAGLDRSSRRKTAFRMRIAASVAIVVSAFGTGYYFGNHSEAPGALAENYGNSAEGRGSSGEDGVNSTEGRGSSGEAGVGLAKGQDNSDGVRDNSPTASNILLAKGQVNSPAASQYEESVVSGTKSNEVRLQPEWNNDASKVLAANSVVLPTDLDEIGEESPILLERVQVARLEPAIPDQLGPIKCKGCSPWSIAVEGAPVIAFREVRDASPSPIPGNTPATASNAESTTDAPLWGWSGGIEIAYQNNPRWQFASGINYHQMGQQADASFRYSGPVATSSTPTLIVSSTAGEIATTLTDAGSLSESTSFETVDGEVIKSPVDQQFNYLEVPLTATYLIGNGKFKVGIEGGVAGNFLTNNQVYSASNNDVVIGTTEGARDFIWSAVGGVELAYQLSSNVSLTAGPQVRYGLQSAIDNTYFKPYSVGLAAGVSYRL